MRTFQRQAKFYFAAAILCLWMVSPSFAEESPWAGEENYIDRVSGKMDYGMRNFYLGWSEIFNQPIEHHDGVAGTLKSFGKGLIHMPIYTLGGILNLVTLPITSIYVPLPNGGLRRFEGEAPGGYFRPS